MARMRLRRLRRTGVAVLYAALAVGLLRLAITRWNGVPADPSGAGLVGPQPPLPIEAGRDRTEELVAALAAIPPLPKLVLPPPPEGMRWGPRNYAGSQIDVSDVLYGAWTPETRPNLRAVVAYLNSPAVRKAMERLAAIESGGCRAGALSLVPVRRAGKMFVARARLRHAGLGDVDGALTDLETVYRLASICFYSGDGLPILMRPFAEDCSFFCCKRPPRTPGHRGRRVRPRQNRFSSRGPVRVFAKLRDGW